MDGSTCLAVVSFPNYHLLTNHEKMMQPKAMSSTWCLTGFHYRVRTYSSGRDVLGLHGAGEMARKRSLTAETHRIRRNHSLSMSIRTSATVTPVRPSKVTRQNDGGDSRFSSRSISQVRHF